MYAQVMKQLVSNSGIYSVMQGWRLLAVFGGHFAPSLDFLPFVVAFVRGHAPSFAGFGAGLEGAGASSSKSGTPPLPPAGTLDFWSENARSGLGLKLTVPQAAAIEGAWLPRAPDVFCA